MKICIFGATGFYGTPLYSNLSGQYEVVGTSNSKQQEGIVQIDISDKKQVGEFLEKQKPNAVINLVAITDVDLCERDKNLARKVNLEGAENVARACWKIGAKLFHFSTDFVFDGKRGNYSEKDSPNPLSYYGRTKYLSETKVLKNKGNVVIRTSTPYGIARGTKKFLNIAIEKLSKGEKISAFTDIVKSPTLVEDVAQNFDILLEGDFSGIVNIAGATQISMYDAALEIADVFGFDPNLVGEGKFSHSGLIAPRPLNSGLDISLANSLGIKMCTLREGLLRIKRDAKAKG